MTQVEMFKPSGSSTRKALLPFLAMPKPPAFGDFHFPPASSGGRAGLVLPGGVQHTRVLLMLPSKKVQILNQVTVYKADLCQI